MEAIETAEFAEAAKVGWQAERRFWEDEEIYGGISYTNHDIQQFWYPSVGHFSGQKATLTGAYAAYDAARNIGELPIPDRLREARRGGALIHDQVADPEVIPDRHGMSVAWHKVPWQAGGWAHWNPQVPEHEVAFQRLQEPDGRLAVIGDQVSQWPGWQEGCVATADRAVGWVDGASTRSGDVAVPDSRWLTTGDHPWP